MDICKFYVKGGGLGGTRNGPAEMNVRHSGRVENFERSVYVDSVLIWRRALVIEHGIRSRKTCWHSFRNEESRPLLLLKNVAWVSGPGHLVRTLTRISRERCATQ